MTFTFFDLMAAMRHLRPLKFRSAAEDFIDIPVVVRNMSRDGRTWEITTDSGRVFQWEESNTLVPVISDASGPIRIPSRFNFFDLVAAIRGIRALKFTTGGVVTQAIPTDIESHSRTSSEFVVVTTNGSFNWSDSNAGETVISEL